jgi:HD-like signal output (HDOD) protein
MALNYLHSGHIQLAVRHLPAMPNDCSAIEAVLNLRDCEAHLVKLGGKLHIPSLPESLTYLNQAVQQPYPNLQQIVNIIEQDPLLSGDILHTLRQPAFQSQLKRRVDIVSIHQCVNLIGFERLYQLALANGIKQLAGTDQIIKHLVGYAAKTAYACAEIAGYLPPQEHPLTQERAYLFGLYLHGGMFALAGSFALAYAAVIKQSLSLPQSAYIQEQQSFVAHDQIGVLVARQWGLNEAYKADSAFLTAIAYHHHPQYECIKSAEIRLMIATGLLAQSMVNELVYQAYQSQELLDQAAKASRVIGLSDEALSNIRKNLSSYWLKSASSD